MLRKLGSEVVWGANMICDKMEIFMKIWIINHNTNYN